MGKNVANLNHKGSTQRTSETLISLFTEHSQRIHYTQYTIISQRDYTDPVDEIYREDFRERHKEDERNTK